LPHNFFGFQRGIVDSFSLHLGAKITDMGILDNAKQVAKAVEEIHNLELYQRVLGLHSDIIELVEENNRLRGENAELRKQKEIKGKLRVVDDPDPVYYLYDAQGKREDGPFCTVCWDIDNKLVRPFSYRDEGGGRGHICEYCRSHRSRPAR
jgi:hypothetical protein